VAGSGRGGDGKAPHSNLYVSPAHAIYIDGILICASNLVNGVTIVADAKPEALSLTYFHIELDTHEAILAEAFAVESYQRDNPKCVRQCRRVYQILRLTRRAFDALCAYRPLS
jgi:hypothetical protein